jgi:kinetochore protein Mis13/DSN1
MNGFHFTSKNHTLPTTSDGAPSRRAQDKPPANKKRRIGELTRSPGRRSSRVGNELTESPDYDEEDDGFMFTRAKARKSRPSTSKSTSIPEHAVAEEEKSRPAENDNVIHTVVEPEPKEPPKKRRNKMSFSTPNVRVEKPIRRSKRLSDEAERRDGSPQLKVRRKNEVPAEDSKRPDEAKRPPEQQKTPRPIQVEPEDDHSATKIALPFADTPVIRKNRAMREGKGGKGERRSSLGLRGRRASSLIDSGSSNGKHDKGRESEHLLI